MIGSAAAEQTGTYHHTTALRIYKDFFESAFLEETREFYQREVVTLLSNGLHGDYMRKVSDRVLQRSVRRRDSFF